MSEYKPTLAVLFSELLINPKTSLEYEWWGYADLDLICINIIIISFIISFIIIIIIIIIRGENIKF